MTKSDLHNKTILTQENKKKVHITSFTCKSRNYLHEIRIHSVGSLAVSAQKNRDPFYLCRRSLRAGLFAAVLTVVQVPTFFYLEFGAFALISIAVCSLFGVPCIRMVLLFFRLKVDMNGLEGDLIFNNSII